MWGWTCFYLGVAAVGVGSSYYHLKPDDATLVWDRLPVSFFYIETYWSYEALTHIFIVAYSWHVYTDNNNLKNVRNWM